jgi:DNA-binding Xre family transcriptional regulator
MKPEPDIRTILQEAIERKRLQNTVREIASAVDVDSGNLSKFLHGKRDLGAQALDTLCRQLGVQFQLPDDRPFAMRSLLDAMREAIHRYPGSRRAIAKHTEIDVGNLSRFSRGLRDGLKLSNLERLRKFLKLKIIWTGDLVVFAHRRVGKHGAVPIEAVKVACMEHVDLDFSARQVFGRKTTDKDGKGIFPNVPIGLLVDVVYGEKLKDAQTIEMVENPQEFAIEL